MLTYTFAKDRKEPLYQQLYARIKEDILCGRLAPHTKLPSKRSLAQHLMVSVATVQNAYSQLIAEGYLYTKEKQGHFVSALGSSMPVVPIQSGVEPYAMVDVQPEYFLDLRGNSLSEEDFPFSTWAKIMREVISEQGKGLLQPLGYNGVPELRSAIADYLFHFRGMCAAPGQIIIGAGSEYLYNLILQLFGKDVCYGFENPGYEKIRRIFHQNQVEYCPIALDQEGLSCLSLYASRAQVIHISPAHHYPTGVVMPISRRQELLAWAARSSERYIIEDDYDSEFRFTGRPIPTLFSIDHQQRVIYMNTFTKSIAPSIRISYMVLPWPLLERFRKEMGFYSCTVSSFEQYTLAKFMASGGFERHMNRMKKTYRQKRDRLIRIVQNSVFADRVSIQEEKAGLHFLLTLRTALSDSEIARRARSVGIRLSFLADYFWGECPSVYQHKLVINYSGLDLSRLPEALQRLEKVFL